MFNNIQLYAERHTGSTWFAKLLKQYLNIEDVRPFGHKHWFPIIGNIMFNDVNDILFIVLTRNCYDWIKAMHEKPWHCENSLKNLSLETFIQTEWKCVWDKESQVSRNNSRFNQEIIIERNPENNLPFNNIIELRNSKNKYFFNLTNITSNVIFLQYEELLKDPGQVLANIANICKINRFQKPTISAMKKNRKVISDNVRAIINSQIDWSIENKLGYFMEE